MKKLPVLLCTLFLTLWSGPSMHGQSVSPGQDDGGLAQEVDWKALEPAEPSLSPQEFEARILSWENLRKASLPQYLDSLRLFLELSMPRYEMQPYVLAECLWFQVAVLPQYQAVERDGSLDKIMELNISLLPEIQRRIAGFYAELGEGRLPVHPWSDAVLSIFQELAENPPAGAATFQQPGNDSGLESGKLPELSALAAGQVFMPVDASFRNVRLYHGMMALESLVGQFAAAGDGSPPADDGGTSGDPGGDSGGYSSGDSGEEAVGVAGLDLLPEVPGVDWEQVVLNQPLMYLLARSASGKEIYTALRTHHFGQTGASRCEELYRACDSIGEQWGFVLERVLPDFSATGITAAREDAFVLYCLPEQDLEQISADLACVREIAPAYFSRTVALLYREAPGGGGL